MTKAQLYHQLIKFRQEKFDPILKQLKWYTETAFLDL